MEYFITDFGENLVATDKDGNIKFILDRYGVWKNSGNPKVVETSDDSEYLAGKYEVTSDPMLISASYPAP